MTVALVASSIVTDSGQLGGDCVINKPGPISDGHFLLAFVTTVSGAGNAPTAPGGWSAGPQLAADCRLDYKFASSEPASWTWVVPGAANGAVIFAAFSGVYVPNPFGDTDFIHTTTSGNIDLPSVDADAETLYNFQWALKAVTAANTWTPPGGITEDAVDATLAGGTAYKYGGGHQTLTPGASGTQSWDPSNTGSNQVFGANILLRDADAIKNAAFLGLI